MKPKTKGIKRILKAFTYSFSGFIETFRTEAAFRQDLLVCGIYLILALFLNVSVVEKLLMISSLILILLMELTNTAIEVAIDRISDEIHPLSKKAKDIGSLLVLTSFLNAIIIWIAIIYVNFIK